MSNTHPLKIGRDRQRLASKAQIGCNGDTIFSNHGDHGATVIFHDRLCNLSDHMCSEEAEILPCWLVWSLTRQRLEVITQGVTRPSSEDATSHVLHFPSHHGVQARAPSVHRGLSLLRQIQISLQPQQCPQETGGNRCQQPIPDPHRFLPPQARLPAHFAHREVQSKMSFIELFTGNCN